MDSTNRTLTPSWVWIYGALGGGLAALPEVYQVLTAGPWQWQALPAAVLAVAALALAGQFLTLTSCLLLSLLVPGGLGCLRPGLVAPLRRWWTGPVAAQPARALLALQLALIVALPLGIWGWYLAAQTILRTLHNQSLMSLGMILSFLAIAVAGLLGAQALRRLTTMALDRLGLPTVSRSRGFLCLPSLVAATAFLLVLSTIAVWVALEVDLVWVLLPAAALTLVVLLAFLGPHGVPLPSSPLGRWLVALAPLLAFLALGNCAFARMTLQERGLFGPVALGAASGLTDVDGDGFGAWFGGGDCAGLDPQVNPGVRELPGNAVDENCNGKLGLRMAPAEARAEGKAVFPQAPNILLITWDSARADHFSAYGYPKKTTPFVDELAAQSTVFKNAFSSGPNTHHSVPAMLTGKNLFNVAMRMGSSRDKLIVMEEGNVSFAELLKAKGYRTAGVFGHSYFDKKNHWNQGFDDWRLPVKADWKAVTSATLSAEATKVIREHQDRPGQPLFLWVHFYDPHLNYVKHLEAPFPVKTRVDSYDSELWFTDLHTRKVAEEMRKLKGETVVILAADHGDSHGEHGRVGRHRTLHRECLHVPLVIHVPGAGPRTVANTVSMVDLFPTLADLVDAEVPQDTIGQSLLPTVLHGTPPAPAAAWSEVSWPFASPWVHFVAVTTDRGTLIREVLSHRQELYLQGPGQDQAPNLIDQGRPEQPELEGLLDQFLEVTLVPTPETKRIP
jgi:arylsulfatase A-like enzyme